MIRNTISYNFKNIINNNKNNNKKNNNYYELLTFKKLNLLLKIVYPNKHYYKSIIPLNIYQTWHTKHLPPTMKKIVDNIIINNPDFNHYLYDDDDCRNFIKDNFSLDILNAYDKLIPGAFKADLWRYCILYKYGGIYLDIKYEPVNGFKFINLTEQEYWVLDIDKKSIYNALMVCMPNNPILLKAINKIVENVKNKFYGNSPLEPTGPLLLANYFTNFRSSKFCMHHDFYKSHKNRFIYLNNYIIFKSYNSYLDEHAKYKKIDHYSSLWINKNIYK